MGERVCAAIIRNGRILMVRHVHGASDYYTLPGGGIEAGETREEAVIREVQEEVGLSVSVQKQLFYEPVQPDGYSNDCYLCEFHDGQEAVLGFDPELPANAQILSGLKWFTLSEKQFDRHVSRVIEVLGIQV
jgi:8-oxo-dGTP diphosphatase